MRDNLETSENKRERLRQEELRRNPTGNLNDAVTRAETGSLVDLIGGLGWKGTGILILLIVIGFIVASIWFK